MSNDTELLGRYVDEKSETAFTDLVRAHVRMVYSVALRRVGGDVQLAEDITQSVFNDLARKAAALRGRDALGGWLYTSAYVASAATVRRERRRKARELAAHAMQTTNSPGDADSDWTRLRPVIDDAIVELKEEEREAVVLRFFDQRSFSEVGATLRVTEEAARKRVERALDKLRAALQRRGITSTTAALGVALTAIGSDAVPAGFGARVAGHALASTHAAAGSAFSSILSQAWPAAAMMVAGGMFIGSQRETNRQLRAELARSGVESSALASLPEENRRLARELARVEDLRRTAALPPAKPIAAVVASASVRPIAAMIVVSPAGALEWQGRNVTLAQFLQRLRDTKASMDPQATILVRAPDAPFSALTYVIDEARRAGIDHLTVKCNAEPDPKFSSWWF